jgi:hypothetical protein
MGGMVNWWIVSRGAALAFALAVLLFVVLFFVTAGIRHYLAITGMLCIWLSVLAPFVADSAKPRVGYSVIVENNSTATVTIDTPSTFGQYVTADGYWSVHSGSSNGFGSITCNELPSAITIVSWKGKEQPKESASIIRTSVTFPDGFENGCTLVLTFDSSGTWTASSSQQPTKTAPKKRVRDFTESTVITETNAR